jgi:hypothetical protein
MVAASVRRGERKAPAKAPARPAAKAVKPAKGRAPALAGKDRA